MSSTDISSGSRASRSWSTEEPITARWGPRPIFRMLRAVMRAPLVTRVPFSSRRSLSPASSRSQDRDQLPDPSKTTSDPMTTFPASIGIPSAVPPNRKAPGRSQRTSPDNSRPPCTRSSAFVAPVITTGAASPEIRSPPHQAVRPIVMVVRSSGARSTGSPWRGTPAPPGPSGVADQCEASPQSPLPPTQWKVCPWARAGRSRPSSKDCRCRRNGWVMIALIRRWDSSRCVCWGRRVCRV